MKVDLGGLTVDAKRQLLDLDRAEYEDSLYLFLTHAWRYIDSSPWTDGWPIEAIAEHLQAVVDGEIRRLIINVPPRFGKSSITSVAFPAWTWAQSYRGPTSGPGVQFLHASYAQQLTLRDSVKCRRLIESPWYQSMWGDRFTLNSDQNTKSRFSNDKGGERLITSVGAAVTGEGGSCFVAGTMVSTPAGHVPIESLKIGDIILAFDHSRGKVVSSKILATHRRKSNDLYQLDSFSGNRFICTGDHPIFSPGWGYIFASEMGRGDGLIVENGKDNSSSFDLRQLREADGKTTIRSKEGAQAKQSGCLLLENMLLSTSCDKKYGSMRRLRKAKKDPTLEMLFGCLQGNMAVEKSKETILPPLWNDFRNETYAERQDMDNILFSSLCGCGSFGQNAGEIELKLQEQFPILESLQINEAGCFGAGRSRMHSLRGGGDEASTGISCKINSSCPSCGSQPSKQRAGKPDYSLPALSCQTSRWNFDGVSSVASLGTREEWVYDIQVEEFSNFFADGVLVHNCIIVDDPNAASEAFSEATIETTKEWWDGTMSTRLNDPKTGAFVIIQQRLAEDDLTGHILEKERDDWTHLMLPMRYEPERSFVSGIGWKDPRSEPGELLWPERFGDAEVSRLERALGPFSAAGQLQQRPEPAGGGVIKRDWWQLWEDASFPPMDYIVASLDTAYTTKTMNDPSALSIWGVFTSETTAQASRILDADGRPMYIDRSYMDAAPKVMLMHAWEARLEIHELVEKVAKTCRSLKVDVLLIENKAAGHSVAQEIRRLYNHERFGVQLHDPKSQDKLSRLYSIQHLFAEGMIYAPDRSWAEALITQVGQFPKGKHDDMVDTVSQALRHMRDIGLLTRGAERIEEIESMKTYPGGQLQPLYPA